MNSDLIELLRWAVLNKEQLDLHERCQIAEILDRYAQEQGIKEAFNRESG